MRAEREFVVEPDYTINGVYFIINSVVTNELILTDMYRVKITL